MAGVKRTLESNWTGGECMKRCRDRWKKYNERERERERKREREREKEREAEITKELGRIE